MQVPPGQGGPTAALLQALQGKPRTDGNGALRDAAKPVTRTEAPRAVEAAGRSERSAPVQSERGVPAKADGRNFPRGSFVDIRA